MRANTKQGFSVGTGVALTVIVALFVGLIGVSSAEAVVTGRATTDAAGTEPAGATRDRFVPTLKAGSAVSAGGRWTTFFTSQANFVPGDITGSTDVFFKNLANGSIGRIAPLSGTANSVSGGSISADGRMIAFTAKTDGGYPGADNDSQNSVVIYDQTLDQLTGGSPVAFPQETRGVEPESAAISGDGRTVVYISNANHVNGDTENPDVYKLYTYDVETGVVTLYGALDDAGNTLHPAISYDGRYIAFYREAGLGATTCGNNVTRDEGIYRVDRYGTSDSNAVRIDNCTGGVGAGEPNRISITADGSLIAYDSTASNQAADSSGGRDVYVASADGSTRERVSVLNTGSGPGNGGGANAFISFDGRMVAFDSVNDLTGVGGDPNGVTDSWVRDRVASTTTRYSYNTVIAPAEPSANVGASETGGISTPGSNPQNDTRSVFETTTFDDRLSALANNFAKDTFFGTPTGGTVRTDPPSIVSGPAGVTSSSSAAFGVSANGVGGAALTCRIDSQPSADCTGGSASYSGLGDGDHTFETRSTVGGDTSYPARRSFTVTSGSGSSADLQITKTAPSAAVSTGDDLNYTINVRNRGPNTAVGARVQDQLSSSVAIVRATPSQGSCSVSESRLVDCNLADIASGDTVRVTVIVRPLVAGLVANTASTGSDVTDPIPSSNSATQIKQVSSNGVGSSNLSVSLDPATATGAVNKEIAATLRVSNLGPDAANTTRTAVVFSTGLDVVSATPSSGSCEVGVGVECSFGSVASGQAATVDLKVRGSSVRDYRIVAAASSRSEETDVSNNWSGSTVRVTPAGGVDPKGCAANTKLIPQSAAAKGCHGATFAVGLSSKKVRRKVNMTFNTDTGGEVPLSSVIFTMPGKVKRAALKTLRRKRIGELSVVDKRGRRAKLRLRNGGKITKGTLSLRGRGKLRVSIKPLKKTLKLGVQGLPVGTRSVNLRLLGKRTGMVRNASKPKTIKFSALLYKADAKGKQARGAGSRLTLKTSVKTGGKKKTKKPKGGKRK